MEFPVLKPFIAYEVFFHELHHNEIMERTTLLLFTKENKLYFSDLHPNGTDVYECYDHNGIRHLMYVCARTRRYCCLKRDDDTAMNTNITKIYETSTNKLVFTNSFDHAFDIGVIE
jgi:hypothetical protein